MNKHIEEFKNSDKEGLLSHKCTTIDKSHLHLPGPDFINDIFLQSDRPAQVLNNLARIRNTGRLAGTGYMSILPVDQGIEHSAAASFAPNPEYFDPENIVKLAIEGGCSAVASTLGVLGIVSRKFAHKIPFVVKLNHNELLTYPNKFTEAFELAHELGMVTILWCYLRNESFKTDKDYHTSADLTGQANHIGVTIEADIIKQKLPTNNGGFKTIKFGKTNDKVYSELTTENPIDLTRYQLANCYMGRAGLINSGGASSGESDFREAIETAVINKRAGGSGLICGRKAFKRPMKDGIELLHAIQDVYLDESITIA